MSDAPAPAPRRRRLVRKIAAWTIGVLVVLFLVLQFALGVIVKNAAAKVGPAVLGTDIAISNIYTRVFSGKVVIEGLVVGPPENFDANVFELSDFRIDLDTLSLLRANGPIVVREIAIHDPLVSYELKGIHDNLHAILNKLGVSDDEEEEKDEKKDDDEKGGRKVVIKHFLFEHGRVRVAVANGKGAIVPLPTIELHNIGEKRGGITGLEATGQILKSITIGTVKAAAGLVVDVGEVAVDVVKDVGTAAVDVAKDVGSAAVDAVKSIGSIFSSDKDDENDKNIVSDAVDAVKDAGEAAVDTAKEVGDAAVNTVKDAGVATAETVKDVGSATVDAAKDVGNASVDTVKDVGGATVDAAKDVGSATVDAVKDVGVTAVDAVKDVGSAAVGAVKDVGGAAVDAVKDVGGAAVDAVMGIGSIFSGKKEAETGDADKKDADAPAK